MRCLTESVLCLVGMIAIATHAPFHALPAAPVPPPKARPTPPSLAGSWMVLWSGSEWPTVMLAGGEYVAERPGGPRYEGRWAVKGNVLTIEERLVESGRYGHAYTYTFHLRRCGRKSDCGVLEIKPAKE